MLFRSSSVRTTILSAPLMVERRWATTRVVLTEEGIQEEGTHKDLLEQNGLYAQLYNSQFAAGENR